MTTAWTRRLLVGLLVYPLGCEVTVDSGPIDSMGGSGNDAGIGGTGGSGGSAGNAGAGGEAGSAGTMNLAGDGGSAGSGELPPPTCEPEAGDEQDSCLQCIKQNCCTAWQGCADEGCQNERVDLALCVSDVDFPDAETYGLCLSDSSAAGDGLLQANTNEVMNCVNEVVAEGDGGIETTRCGVACFGSDIFFD